MAECKGCIAEQQIQHTCGVHMPHDPRHEVPHHHLACHHHSAAPDLNGLEDISGYNTWPRKGERLKMQPPVQKEVLPPLSSDQTSSSKCSDVTSDSSSTTHSSISAINAKTKGVPSDCAPRDAIQGASANAKPVMYVDSDLNHSQFSKDATDNNIMKPERDTNSTKKSEVDGKISADLKSSDVKGTPLYGQPSWWGEEDGATMLPVSNGTRPELKSMDMSLKSSQSEIDWGYDPQKYKSDPKYSQRYMEIPARDTDPGLESPIAQHESNTSVLSRDSLSPEDSPLKPSKEQSAEIDSAEKTNALPKTDSGGALAFTVDLGDEKPSKKMNMTGSLSEFVPSKIRRSFRERSEKATSKAPKDEPQRDVKDSASQQRKLDELWGYGEERGDADERLPAEGRFVLNSDGEEDEHMQIQHPAYGKKGAKSGDPKSTRLIPAVDSSTYKKPRPGSDQFIRPIHPTADVPLSDPASFLIDKMFETCPPSMSKADRADLDVIPQVTEHALYKESSHHDPGSKSSRSQKNDLDIAELKPRKSGLEPQSTKTRSAKQRGKENVIDAEEGDNDDHLDVTHDIDKTSEAGTYTIEQDEAAAARAEEEKEARQSIDRVFGVGRDGLHRPVVGCNISSVNQSEVNGVSNGTDDASPDRDDVSPDRDDVGSVGQLEHVEEDLERLEWQRAGDGAVLSSMEVEVGSGYDRDGLANNNNKLAMGAPGPLIKQRTFLKEPPSQPSPDSSKSSSSKDSLNSINMSPSDRPPSGSQRKRPGTGRKLPSLPPDKGSPRSDSSPRLSDIVQRSKDFSPRGVNSCRDSPSRKDKSVTISGKVMTHEARLDSTRSDDVTLTNVSSLSADSSQIFVPIRNKKESARSLASIDTEILLRDTETVMAAMEARMVSRERARQSGEFDVLVNCDSDTDASSTVAVVNSDNTPGNTVRAVRQGAVRQGSKSAGQRLTRGRSQEKRSQIPRQDSVPKERQSPITLASLTRKLSLPSGPDRSVVSDIMSDGDDSLSIRSDASTDFSESSPMQARKGSKGKGNITMTRPNRAFQLRRLRAEGSTESPEHTKSEASSVTTSTPKSRPVSGRTGSRPSSTGFPSDRKSDASLGTAIAQKGKQNAAKDQQNFARKDGGRHSLRSQRSTTSTQSSASSRSSGYTRSTASASPSSARSTTSTTTTTRSSLSGSTSTTKTSTPESARKKELRDLKTHLKGKPDLTVMGVSQKSRSQPPSRSNSPKSQERNAWKRRKEYDPRKAVAQAKAKAKASPNPPAPNGSKTKATPTSMQKGLLRMARSASYTNPDDFNKFGRESLGREAMGDSMSSDDLNVELKEEAPQNFDGSRFRQPLKSRGAKSMSNIRDLTGHHSGDENSSSVSEESTDVALYSYGMLGIRPYKSAFTPPPKSSLSPASPPLSPPFRRPHNSHDLYCTQSVPRLANRHSDTHSQSQSYDNLIISSIYQLSLKLKTSTDRTLEKLRDNRRVSGSPSPVFELNSQATAGEIPAWNAANQELAAILKNLRKMDHRMQVINKALFPTEEGAGTESARLTSREKKQYLQEIQRIHELAGFRPIENPEQDWRAEGNDCTEDIEDNTSNVSEIEDFVEEDFY